MIVNLLKSFVVLSGEFLGGFQSALLVTGNNWLLVTMAGQVCGWLVPDRLFGLHDVCGHNVLLPCVGWGVGRMWLCLVKLMCL